MNQKQFLARYNITSDQFEQADVEWSQLLKIYNHYLGIRDHLEVILSGLAERFRRTDKVHTVKARTKDPEHLLEKIIRKRLLCPDVEITAATYPEIISDLIGVRIMHLFKEDWFCIHDFIVNNWEQAEQPIANVRHGDKEKLIESFRHRGLEICHHPYGYRSLHYLIRSQYQGEPYLAEVQVRTIFEEGWSEIDHEVRYPYDIDNSILSDYLVIFNRLAGSADEMGSYVRFLSRELKRMQKSHQDVVEGKNQLIQELKDTISALEIERRQKEDLQKKLERLEEQLGFGHHSGGGDEADGSSLPYGMGQKWINVPDLSLGNGESITKKNKSRGVKDS